MSWASCWVSTRCSTHCQIWDVSTVFYISAELHHWAPQGILRKAIAWSHALIGFARSQHGFVLRCDLRLAAIAADLCLQAHAEAVWAQILQYSVGHIRRLLHILDSLLWPGARSLRRRRWTSGPFRSARTFWYNFSKNTKSNLTLY